MKIMSHPEEVSLQQGVAEFYAELGRVLEIVPDYQAAYLLMNRLFKRLLSECTQFVSVRLVGSFAKLDYLLKERGADKDFVRFANDLRVRLQDAACGKMSISTAQKYWQCDARSLAELAAFAYVEAIPAKLLESLPPVCSKSEPRESVMLVGEVVRLLVEHWDETYVYGKLHSDGVIQVKVCYAGENNHYPYDWSYLHALWHEGAQANLIRAVSKQGVLYPELIILEPDYLVDISQIARCFSVYAESPLVSLVDRMRVNEPSEPMLLGFLASRFLDEELHDLQYPYSQSAMDFFRTNAIDLLATKITPAFHERAQIQRANIHNAVSVQLPMLASRYNKEDVVVEPSFVSEMLGLQGRMDFLQWDMRVLIEQKSGKAAFVPHDPDPESPKPREEHYVQMLLYMAVLRYQYREVYERNHRQLYAFLMYSAYSNALVGLSFAPELLFRALRLRNRLVRMDMCLANDGFDILCHLTPESLNEKGISGRLWKEFVRPQLEQVLHPIHAASDLERNYYLRMLQFVATEHQLAKLGSETKENSGFASTWHDSLDEKRQAGNIYDSLLLKDIPKTGYISSIGFVFFRACDSDTSNFRTGDAVVVYSYECGAQPDVRRGILFRGTLGEIGRDSLMIHLRNGQTDAKVFLRDRDCFWAVEHDFVESTTTQLYAGIHSFLSAPLDRRNLLLMQRPPSVDLSVCLQGDYGCFNELQLRVKQARDLFLIIGPPGTGKTSFGMYYALREELLSSMSNVLVMAYTNRAVDEICSKLEGNIDYIRIGSEYSCSPTYRNRLLCNRVVSCRNTDQLHQLLLDTRVIVGTTTALSSMRSLFALKCFSLAIIDEASQILEPSLLMLMSMRCQDESAIRKFVLIGDHKQLPAVVQQRRIESEVSDPLLREIGLTDCRQSLFERMLHRYANNPQYCYMLTRQGRMHPSIAKFPNQAFYGNRLEVVPLPHQYILDDISRVRFYDVRPIEDGQSDKANEAEAVFIASLVKEIYCTEANCFDVSSTVGIIVPYRNQIATVRMAISRLGIPILQDITIDTVERFQGSQRRYIIYGFTIRFVYQLRFLTEATFLEGETVIDRKLNVAMTRAQEYLLLVGNVRLLQNNALFARLIDEVGITEVSSLSGLQ